MYWNADFILVTSYFCNLSLEKFNKSVTRQSKFMSNWNRSSFSWQGR